jgi:hypothetical protein
VSLYATLPCPALPARSRGRPRPAPCSPRAACAARAPAPLPGLTHVAPLNQGAPQILKFCLRPAGLLGGVGCCRRPLTKRRLSSPLHLPRSYVDQGPARKTYVDAYWSVLSWWARQFVCAFCTCFAKTWARRPRAARLMRPSFERHNRAAPSSVSEPGELIIIPCYAHPASCVPTNRRPQVSKNYASAVAGKVEEIAA